MTMAMYGMGYTNGDVRHGVHTHADGRCKVPTEDGRCKVPTDAQTPNNRKGIPEQCVSIFRFHEEAAGIIPMSILVEADAEGVVKVDPRTQTVLFSVDEVVYNVPTGHKQVSDCWIPQEWID